MAEPVTTALVTVGKKVVVDVITDPGKAVKFVVYGIIVPVLSILLVFFVPVILLVSLPMILVSLLSGDGDDPTAYQAQLDTIAIYQDAPIKLNNVAMVWVESKKTEYSWCDDVQVQYSFGLLWQDILAIDTVLLNQDFNGVTSDHVMEIASKYLVQSEKTESYQAVEEYQAEEKYMANEQYYDPNTRTLKIRQVEKTRMVTKERTVTKTRAVLSVSTKSFYQVLGEMGFTSEQTDIAENVYSTILQYDIEGKLNIYDDIDLSNLKEYPPGSANLPYFNQTDVRWGASSYGYTGNIADSGCGPTSLAMVVAGLTGRGDINPQTIADWSVANGHRAEGAGSYWSLMTAGGANFGLTVEAVSRQNPDRIVEALSQGYPVIVSMGRGHFTKSGHFIVLRGLTDDGKILVHDPVSVKRTEQAWDLGIIMNESSTNGGVDGSPFWIFLP